MRLTIIWWLVHRKEDKKTKMQTDSEIMPGPGAAWILACFDIYNMHFVHTTQHVRSIEQETTCSGYGTPLMLSLNHSSMIELKLE